MEKINIAELLKDCPKGMELDCTMFDGVYFDHVDDLRHNSIKCYVNNGNEHFGIALDEHGQYISNNSAKCVIFPKGKTTWEGFVPPCKFKDGDIVATDSGRWLGIIKNKYDFEYYTVHCAIDYTFNDIFYRCGEYRFSRLATKEEKEKLFQAIKDNGYKWNPETKTLEKLIEPRFKVGDRIRHKTHIRQENIVTEIKDTHYILDNELALPFISQDEYELVPNKFDITTLKPFDKVLVRNHEKNEWQPNFFNRYCKEINSFKLIGVCTPSYAQHEHFVNYCIPYKGNEHLLGTTDDCDEYFKIWK